MNATPPADKSRRLWLVGLLVAVAVVAAMYLGTGKKPAQPVVQAPSTASGELDALVEQYAAIERAGEKAAGGLHDVTLAAFRQELDTRRQLLQKVRKSGADGLSREEDIDRRLMIGLLESSIRTAEVRRVWENDAALYVPASEIGRALEPTAPGSPQERAGALAALLGKVAARLEEGQRNLVKPPRSYTEAAIFKTEGTIKLLRGGVPRLAHEAGEPGDALSAASDTALASLENYLQFLRNDLLPRSTGTWVFGKENYDYVLRHRWMMQTDAEAILERGRKAFAETEVLAQQVARRIDPRARSWVDVYEKIKNDHPDAGGIKQAYQAKIDAAKAFVIEHRIVTLPAGERVTTIDTPPAMRRSSPFGTFQSVDPFDDGLQVRFDRYAAGLDVGMYTQRPTYVLGYLIGMQEIAAIRDDYIRQYGEPSPPSELYDRLLGVGSIPPALVRESLFAQKAAEAGAAYVSE